MLSEQRFEFLFSCRHTPIIHTKTDLLNPKRQIFFLKLTALLLEDAVTVGVEKVLQVGDLGAEFLTLVGVGDEHTVGGHLDDLGG